MFPSQKPIGRHSERNFENLRRLTATEVAKLENVSRRTVLNWHRAGIIPAAFAIERTIRFDIDEVREALARYNRAK